MARAYTLDPPRDLIASGVGDLAAWVIRPLGWVSLAFASYVAIGFFDPVLGLAAGLLTLFWSASRFGIAAPDELRILWNWYGSTGIRGMP